MNEVLNLFLKLSLIFFAPAVAGPYFWEEKPALQAKIFENNEILVSVINQDGHAKLSGVGLIRASAEEVALVATDTEKIRSRVNEIKELTWNRTDGAFRARIQLLWIDRVIEGKAFYFGPEKDLPRRIQYHIEKGLWFTGQGTLQMRETKNGEQCVTIIDAQTGSGKELSWPVRVGLEAALQRMAGSLRKYVEEDRTKMDSHD